MRQLLIWIISGLCLVLPFLATIIPLDFTSGNSRYVWMTFIPIVFLVSFVVVAGALSRLGLRGLREGRFKRDIADYDYFLRRVHATPWTILYYFVPVYSIVLSVGPLKALAFRLFGYKGNLNFTVYPDTWLRDIPILDFGQGVYLSNKSSIATNICLMDGTIMVDGIQIGAHSCVGHGTLIGPGTKMAEKVELGANITSGIRVKYGKGSKVYEMCGIQHGVVIGENAIIEGGAILGLRTRIGNGVRIKEGSHIHTGLKIQNQEEADKYFSDETGAMTKRRLELAIKVGAKYTSADHVQNIPQTNFDTRPKIKLIDE